MEPYIVQLRSEYLPWSAGAYARKGWEVCIGSAGDCEEFEEDGAARVSWGQQPGTDRDGVRSLILKPGAKGLRDKAPPAWVRELSGLEHLFLPTTMVAGIEPGELPESLLGLTLRNFAGAAAVAGKAEPRWPPEVSLLNVKSLRLLDEPGSEQSKSLLGLSPGNLPSLKYVECLVNRSVGRLEDIREFTGLEFVWLEFVKSYDVVDYISSPVKALSLVNADGKFPFSRLGDLPSLELVRLNGMKGEIDCGVFTGLPRLREVVVLNSRKIVNPEALLECERLESIDFLNCGRPFGEAVRQRLKARSYARLEIDFA